MAITNQLGTATGGNDGAGVRIMQDGTDYTIGGDEEFEENEFAGNADGAIVIEDSGSDGNQVLRNTASANPLFIDLGDDGLGGGDGANDLIAAPVISSATLTAASGTAKPGATIQLYAKDTASNGEIAGFVGSTTAAGDGTWTIAYSPAPAFIGATQTDGGTSELAVAQPGSGSGGGGGGGGGGADVTAPETTITKHPKKKGTKRKAKFKFESSEDGSSFECKLDKKPYKPCTSPYKKKVKLAKHKFRVRATDAAGNTDGSPAKFKFKVKPKP